MDEFRNRLDTVESGEASYRVYTTLDPGLQSAAADAVRVGAQSIDALLRKKRGGTSNPVLPQVALIALDAHTGEVKAVVGGRNYGTSQLNHALTARQPGSVFKPFVYAAALANQTKEGYSFTPSSMVDDEPTAFHFGNTVYEPGNFGDRFYGRVTLRKALAKSMNVATVSLAEAVGYGRVVELAKRAGLNDGLRATPALALGAYEVTPLEMAGAYTVFANEGICEACSVIVRNPVRERASVISRRTGTAAGPRPKVAFLMRSLLEEVVQSGTAAGVCARGSERRWLVRPAPPTMGGLQDSHPI